MSPETLFSDPAIVGLSSSGSTNSGENKHSGLGPGSALSKLLDSAMANAAKETTPDPEENCDGNTDDGSSLKSNRSSFVGFVPSEKSDLSKTYSISDLMELRTCPGVLSFDVSCLPEQSFWRTKQKGTDGHSANGRNSSHGFNGPSLKNSGGKRNRRNQLAAAAAAAASATAVATTSVPSDSLNWDRKPAGFLKNPDIDHMSSDKISQLLGEAAEEETPDWELPGSNTDSKIDMGNTVADFERWKQHMRQEERRHNNTNENARDFDDKTPSNEVDSFFSFAKPKESKSDNASLSFSKPAESKSSRFSSFFGTSPAVPDNDKVSTRSSDSSSSAYRGLKTDHPTGNSRFFNVDAQTQTSNPGPSTEIETNAQEMTPHGPPPGISPNVQNSNLGPSRSAISVPPGFPAQSNFPPGFRMQSSEHPSAQVPVHPPSEQQPIMMPTDGRVPVNNDSFFLSLLKKSDPASTDHEAMPNVLSQPGVNTVQNKQSDKVPQFTNGMNAAAGLNDAGFPRPNTQQAKQHAYHPYQDQSLGFPQQPINSKVHAGMKPVPGMPFPPGMYPPGMFPPGMQALPHHGPNPHLSQQNGPANGQIMGDMPPPWMRLNSGVPRGVVPPGFAPPPPGFPPGFPQHAPNSQQQVQKDGQ